MEHERVCWAAGLLEGEGSFFGARRGTNELRITCQMTDFDVILALQDVFGGHVYYPKLGGKQVKPTALWSTGHSKHAYDVMQQILPLMGKRRSEKIRAVCSEYEKNGLIKLTKRLERDSQIHKLRGEGMIMREIAEQVGCCSGTVKNVLNGRK